MRSDSPSSGSESSISAWPGSPPTKCRLTRSGAIMGTPAYMAPEQARAKQVDHRADLFSLGVMLYEMTTGRRPFEGNDTMSILSSFALDEPTVPNLVNVAIPRELSELIMQLLSKDPEKRPADGRVVSEALLAISDAGDAACCRGDAPDRERAAGVRRGRDGGRSVAGHRRYESVLGSKSRSCRRNGAAVTRAKRKSGGGKVWVALGLALLLVGGGFAAYKLLYETKDGTLVVEVDGDADVRFKSGELNIFDSDGKLKYTLKAGERSKAMPPGKYTLAVVVRGWRQTRGRQV